MAVLRYNNQSYTANDSAETVLDTLLSHGVDFPHSCKIGTCQSCLVKLVDGEVSADSQKGLKPTLAAKDYFLACQCKLESDMTIALPAQDETAVASKVVSLSMLNHNVMRVRLAIDNPDDMKAGQYISLVAPENIIRSYSIANVPAEYIELHVKLIPDGLMSSWLSQQAKVGSPVFIRGPVGDCFYYNPQHASFPIVLAGTGTGLAPLVGIVKDAIANEHDGEIILIHGGVDKTDLYLHEALNKLQQTHSNFTYVPCTLKPSANISQEAIADVLVEQLKNIVNDVQLFVCGPEETTKKMKLKAFLAGVPSASIYSDAFITPK
ncbi:MAG: FAD-binding oxidoreductase [Coxiellaceae bacterium]|nr:FAD-binding oxidoreductase [Coxiellaceae bacterium]